MATAQFGEREVVLGLAVLLPLLGLGLGFYRGEKCRPRLAALAGAFTIRERLRACTYDARYHHTLSVKHRHHCCVTQETLDAPTTNDDAIMPCQKGFDDSVPKAAAGRVCWYGGCGIPRMYIQAEHVLLTATGPALMQRMVHGATAISGLLKVPCLAVVGDGAFGKNSSSNRSAIRTAAARASRGNGRVSGVGADLTTTLCKKGALRFTCIVVLSKARGQAGRGEGA